MITASRRSLGSASPLGRALRTGLRCSLLFSVGALTGSMLAASTSGGSYSLVPAAVLNAFMPSSAASFFSSSASASSSAKPSFSYQIAASFTGKGRPFDPSTHVFNFNPYNRIQPPRNRRKSARPDSGQDAFFVSRVGNTGSVAFGVADGVGGWMDSGVDPADFSHGFCDYMAAAAYEYVQPSGSSKNLTARSLMQKGYDAICDDPRVQAGGSTASVAIASAEGTLEVANLGDSGFLQLRLNAVHAYSEPQTHAFNTPFQLSLVPPSVAARMAAFGGAQLRDYPQDADVTHHSVQHGDIVVFATDGVFDNLFNQDILRIASRVMLGTGAWRASEPDGKGGVRVADLATLEALTQAILEGSQQQQQTVLEKTALLQSLLATELVQAAKQASMDKRRDGPFAKEVQRYYPKENWHGGKVDDICVVVAVVLEQSAPAPIKSKL